MAFARSSSRVATRWRERRRQTSPVSEEGAVCRSVSRKAKPRLAPQRRRREGLLRASGTAGSRGDACPPSGSMPSPRRPCGRRYCRYAPVLLVPRARRGRCGCRWMRDEAQAEATRAPGLLGPSKFPMASDVLHGPASGRKLKAGLEAVSALAGVLPVGRTRDRRARSRGTATPVRVDVVRVRARRRAPRRRPRRLAGVGQAALADELSRPASSSAGSPSPGCRTTPRCRPPRRSTDPPVSILLGVAVAGVHLHEPTAAADRACRRTELLVAMLEPGRRVHPPGGAVGDHERRQLPQASRRAEELRPRVAPASRQSVGQVAHRRPHVVRWALLEIAPLRVRIIS